MLDVLKKMNYTNDGWSVVTRYFGGTKLGAGGLIRAYASTVAAALKEIGIVEGTLNQTLLFDHRLSSARKAAKSLRAPKHSLSIH